MKGNERKTKGNERNRKETKGAEGAGDFFESTAQVRKKKNALVKVRS